jgi:hypothetical protein
VATAAGTTLNGEALFRSSEPFKSPSAHPSSSSSSPFSLPPRSSAVLHGSCSAPKPCPSGANKWARALPAEVDGLVG